MGAYSPGGAHANGQWPSASMNSGGEVVPALSPKAYVKALFPHQPGAPALVRMTATQNITQVVLDDPQCENSPHPHD